MMASTSAQVAMVVSPGVVMARAPWAVPYSTAFAASPVVMSPYTRPDANESPPPTLSRISSPL